MGLKPTALLLLALCSMVRKIFSMCPVRGGCTLEAGTPGRCVLILQLGYNEPSSPKERDFAPVAGSAAVHQAGSAAAPISPGWQVLCTSMAT